MWQLITLKVKKKKENDVYFGANKEEMMFLGSLVIQKQKLFIML